MTSEGDAEDEQSARDGKTKADSGAEFCTYSESLTCATAPLSGRQPESEASHASCTASTTPAFSIAPARSSAPPSFAASRVPR